MTNGEKKFIDDNFFVISKDNLQEIEPKFYGYATSESEILFQNTKLNKEIDELSYGAYINIVKQEDNRLLIQQDFFGSYGIFVYLDNDYFAISNSLFYLCEYLRKRKSLSIDYDYAKMLFCCDLVPLSFKKTIIKEIFQLPPNENIIIDTISKSIKFIKKSSIKYFDIATKQAIDLIDFWHKKWNSLVNNLHENFPVSVDLSGGFDSRASFSICLKENINFNKIKINTIDDNMHTHKEDFRIASEIAKQYGFKLNQAQKYNTIRFSNELTFMISQLTKGSYHKQMYWKTYYNITPRFVVTGAGGESLRDYWSANIDDFKQHQMQRGFFEKTNFSESIQILLDQSVRDIEKSYCDDKLNMSQKLYNYIRQRNHFCKSIVENFLSNTITLAPLMDPILYQIDQTTLKNKDRNLLFAFIYDRYMPEIQEVKIQGGREFKEETLSLAHRLNTQNPINNIAVSFLKQKNLFEDFKRTSPPQKDFNNTTCSVKEECLNRFESKFFKDFIDLCFSKDVYIDAEKYYKNTTFFPESKINALLSIYISIKLSESSKCLIYDEKNIFMEFRNSDDYFNNGLVDKIIHDIQSSRIDIIQRNSEIKIIQDSGNINCLTPSWFIDKSTSSQGHVILSTEKLYSFYVETKDPGNIEFRFIGIDVRDKSNKNKRIPYIVDYKSINIFNCNNNKDVFNIKNCTPAWHDKGIYAVINNTKTSKESKPSRYKVIVSCAPHSYTFEQISEIFTNYY